LIKTFILIQHEGSFRLDDTRHLHNDEALRTVLGLDKRPQATTQGDGLRRIGDQPQSQRAVTAINKVLLTSALHNCKKITHNIDASEIISNKSDAQ